MMYDLYKPLRNDLRRQSSFQSLHVVWAWVLLLPNGQESCRAVADWERETIFPLERTQ